MTDPTRLNPTVGGAPPAGPPPGGPPTGGPPTGGPPGDGPDGSEGMDRRLVAILGLLGAIVVLLVILLVVIANDEGDDPAVPSSTTTTEVTTTTTPSTTTEATTTTTESTTTTSSTSTTIARTSTTTTTTAPPPTIAPARCIGAPAADDPSETAIVFYDAWTIDDTDCAGQVASDDAIDTLFAADGSSAEWSFEGCTDDGVGRLRTECAFRYQGGSAFFEMRVDAEDRWEVGAVRLRAD